MPKTNTLAVVSLVFGILAWTLCPFIGAIVAVISGHGAKREIASSGEAGSGLATAGVILGYTNLGVTALVIFAWILIVFFTLVAHHGSA